MHMMDIVCLLLDGLSRNMYSDTGHHLRFVWPGSRAVAGVIARSFAVAAYLERFCMYTDCQKSSNGFVEQAEAGLPVVSVRGQACCVCANSLQFARLKRVALFPLCGSCPRVA